MLKKILPLLIFLVACTAEQVENAYSTLPANFVFRSCATVPQMRAALGGSPGAFFIVRATADNKYIITSNDDADNSYTYQKDAVDQKVTFLCRSGFIIGTPIFSSTLEAYDLACPNCYRNDITRALTFDKNIRTRLVCTRCNCAYSLDDAQGILVEGNGDGKVLLRYHVSYDGLNNLTVRN